MSMLNLIKISGISSAILVAGLILILRRRRGKNIEKEVEKEIKSEPVKEYKVSNGTATLIGN